MSAELENLVLSATAQQALKALSFKYELITGQRILWKKNPQEIYRLVGESFNHKNKELVTKARQFLNQLSPHVKTDFVNHGIYDSDIINKAQTKTLTYPGTTSYRINEANESPANSSRKKTKPKRMYRGSEIT